MTNLLHLSQQTHDNHINSQQQYIITLVVPAMARAVFIFNWGIGIAVKTGYCIEYSESE